MRILYVEDDPFDADLTRRALQKTAPHFSMEIARNLKEARHMIETAAPYDMMLTDLHLPDGTGMSLLSYVRERRLAMAVVVITGQGDEEIAVSALKAGANDYLVKRQDYLDHLWVTLEAARSRYQAETVAYERPVRVLYLENDPADFEAVRRHFAAHARHIRLEIVSTVGEALNRLPADRAEPDCDVLMLDYQQQEMTALDLLKELRQVRRIDLPIVLVTAQGDEELAVLALRLGAYDYVVKAPGYLYRLPGLMENAHHRYQLTREQAALRLSEERIRRQLSRLSSLRSIDSAITANLNLKLILGILLDHALAQLSVDAADVLVYEPEQALLTYRAGLGFRFIPEERLRSPVGEDPAEQFATDRHIVQSNRAKIELQQDGLAEIWRQEGFEACYSAPLVAKRQVLGVLDIYLRSPLNPDAEWLDFLETIAGQAAIAIDNAALLDGLQRANRELMQAYDTTLEGWVHALDLRDKETEVHTRRVTEMTLELARAMGIADDEMIHIRRGALLHDIGKVGIPDGILLKPAELTPSEWEIMRRHPEYAYRLLSDIDFLRQSLDIPYYHHERWDGGGYPKGLSGEQIPLSARVFAVVDVWDALSSDRPYRDRWPKEKILDYLHTEKGKHFDPQVVEVFLNLIDS